MAIKLMLFTLYLKPHIYFICLNSYIGVAPSVRMNTFSMRIKNNMFIITNPNIYIYIYINHCILRIQYETIKSRFKFIVSLKWTNIKSG